MAAAGSDQAATGSVLDQAAIDAAPDALLVVDETGTILLVNDECLRMFGYERGQLEGREVEVLLPESRRQVHRAHRTRYRSDPHRRPMGSGIELHGRRKDGTEFPVEISLNPTLDRGELRVVAAIRDLTVRHAEAVQREVVRTALDAITDAVFLFSPDDLHFVHVNEGAVVQTGYRRDELLGAMTPLHVLPDVTRAELARILDPLLEGSTASTTVELVHRQKDGEDVPVEVTLQYPEPVSHDHPRLVVAVARDVTDRLEAVRQARASEAAFESAFHRSPIPMVMLELRDGSPSGFRRANRAFLALLGTDARDLDELTLEDVVHPSSRRVATEVLTGRRQAEGPALLRLTAPQADQWVEASAVVVPGEEEASPYVLVQLQIVTGRVQAEVERDATGRSMGLLEERERIARDLHDMIIQRLFATGMRLQAILSLAEGPVAERVNEAVDELDGAIADLRTTIFRLNDAADDALPAQVGRMVETRLHGFEIEPVLDIDLGPDGRGADRLDDHAVEHLMATLNEALTNVVRHAGATRVEVSLRADERRVELRVEDDGIGIDEGGDRRGNGIDNMLWRAATLGGHCSIGAREGGGTCLEWEVPLHV